MDNIVLTGAIKDGYGEAIFRKLNILGYNVYGTYEEELKEKADKLKQEFPNSKLFQVDHSDRKALAKFTDILVNKEIKGIVIAQMFFNMENQDDFDFNFKNSLESCSHHYNGVLKCLFKLLNLHPHLHLIITNKQI